MVVVNPGSLSRIQIPEPEPGTVLTARRPFSRATPSGGSGVHLDLAAGLATPGIPAANSLLLPCSPTRQTIALGDGATGIFQPLFFRFRCHRGEIAAGEA